MQDKYKAKTFRRSLRIRSNTTLNLNRILLFLGMLLSMSAQAQDNLGIAGSTRAPANTVLINPSSIVDSRAWLDLNLTGVSLFARNNLAYIPGKSVSFRNPESIPLPSYNRDGAPFQAYADVAVHGPSVTFAIRQHAFGLYTGFRTVVDARGVDRPMSFYLTEGWQYQPQMGTAQNVRNLRANGLSWGEIGITYGTIVSRSGDMITQAGITAKRLYGVAGVGLRLDTWDYTVRDSSRLETTALSGEYGFNDVDFDNPSQLQGRGWGFDVGITFKQRRSESTDYTPHNPCTDGDYNYKFGFSLLDLGAVRFNGPFYRNRFTQEENTDWNQFNEVQLEDTQDLDSLFNSGLGVSRQTADQSRFSMMLPGAFSAQLDYNLGHNFYIFGIVTAGIPWLNRLGVQRASYLGIAPRYERKRLEASLPLSLYEWRYPQVGLMLRLNSIVIGSDNLGWRMFGQRVYGADVYVSIKYTLFKNPKCRKSKSKKAPNIRPGRGLEPVPCPVW
jgi:hypothetical protein